MVDFLIQATLSNLVLATLLAFIAWGVQCRIRSASLANLLWALVLIKMVTPPLFSFPVFEVTSVSRMSAGLDEVSNEMASPTNQGGVNFPDHPRLSGTPEIPASDTSQQSVSTGYEARVVKLGFVWWLGISTVLLLVSAFRITRFHRLLKANSRIHHPLSSRHSTEVARQYGLLRQPQVFVTTANMAPFVWWMKGRSVIVVSKRATEDLNDNDLRLVIAHEMAHIKRWDHWFRWLEWIALLGFWWNPVMWWARQQLRISEEMACDDLVLETATPEIHQYANSLLNMAELLATSAIRPPVVASAINSGGCLEKRLKMMIAENNQKIPSALRLAIVAVAICVFPLGIVYAQDFDAVERRLGGTVEAGELTLEHATIMLQALKRSAKASEGDAAMAAKKQRYLNFIMQDLEAAFKEGRVSKEDAEQKLIEVRRRLFAAADEKETRGGDDDRDMEARKLRYMKLAREIEAAVKEGKASKEDAEQKLIEVRRRLFAAADEKETRGGDDDRDMEARKLRYMNLVREIEAAVKEERVSREDAEQKLIEVRRRLFAAADEKETRGGDDDRDMEARKLRYMNLVREIEAAVKEGKVSKEDAEQKLIEVRRRLFAAADEKETRGDDDDRDMEARKQRYMILLRDIEAAVEEGKTSKEDAEKKLLELRRKMFGSDD